MNNAYQNTAQNLHIDEHVSDHVVHKISLDYSQPSPEENALFLQPISTLFPFAGLSALIDLINWREKHLASLDQEKKRLQVEISICCEQPKMPVTEWLKTAK